MGFSKRRPSVKIGGVTIRMNKNGYSVSSKTITGGRKTYNSATGKTTKTYKTGIKGLSYKTVSGGNSSVKRHSAKGSSFSSTNTSSQGKGWLKKNWTLIVAIISLIGIIVGEFIYIIPLVICGGIWLYKRKKQNTTSADLSNNETDADSITNATCNSPLDQCLKVSDAKFPVFDDDNRYLRYSYYDVEVKASTYLTFDISSIELNKFVTFEEEPENEYDPNAIKILCDDIHIGYIPKNNLQGMMIDFKDGSRRQVCGFVSSVDYRAKQIKIALGFYDSVGHNISCIDTKLVSVKKSDDVENRQDNLSLVNHGDPVNLDYDYESERYIVSNCGLELGEIGKADSKKIQDLENEGMDVIAAGVLETEYDDNADIQCKVRILIR